MSTTGYKPTGNARGVGVIGADDARVTVAGSIASAAWLTAAGVRAGRSGAGSTTIKIIGYNFVGSSPGARIFETASFPVNTFMSSGDPAGGTNYERAFGTGVFVPAGTTIALGIQNSGANLVSYGQSNSGAMMYYYSGSGVPDPFNETSASPQGQFDAWVEWTANRAPLAPTMLYPVDNEIITDTTPTLRVQFNDPDSSLGDQVYSYKIDVWNEANTTRLVAGVVTSTDSTMKSTGIVEHTLAALTPATYTLRVNLYDRAGVASPTSTTKVSINSGGAFVNLQMAGAFIAGTSGSNIVTNSTTPEFTATWTHGSAEATQTIKARIRNLDTNTLYRAEKSSAVVVANGVAQTFTFSNLGTTWSAMATGSTRYAIEVSAIDALGGATGWVQSAPFIVNATPSIAVATPANGITVAQIPALSITVTDANDNADAMTVVMQVRPAAGSWTAVPTSNAGGGVYTGTPTVLQMPGYAAYGWKVDVTDPWGLTTSLSERVINYVAPPAFSALSPSDGETIETGTPTITATIDRTITAKRTIIKRADTGSIAYDSGSIAASGTLFSQVVPSAQLPNEVEYDLILSVLASDGLTGTSETTFTVSYPSDEYMQGTTATAIHSSIFDIKSDGIPEQFPNVELTWERVDESVVSNEDWQHVILYRTGGGISRRWYIYDRNQTSYIDTEALPNADHSYFIGYEKYVNDGLDTVASKLAMHTISVVVNHSTITSLDPDDPAATLHFWRDRGDELQTDVTVVPILNEVDPDVWFGPGERSTISGSFEVQDDPAGNYTARDIVEAAYSLARPVRDLDGEFVPRTMFYRDPKRAFQFVMTSISRDDQHDWWREVFSLDGVKVGALPDDAISVNDDLVVDVTEFDPVVPALALMPYGSRDRIGEITPALTGSARIVDTDRAAPGYGFADKGNIVDGLISGDIEGYGATGTLLPDGGIRVTALSSAPAYAACYVFKEYGDLNGLRPGDKFTITVLAKGVSGTQVYAEANFSFRRANGTAVAGAYAFGELVAGSITTITKTGTVPFDAVYSGWYVGVSHDIAGAYTADILSVQVSGGVAEAATNYASNPLNRSGGTAWIQESTTLAVNSIAPDGSEAVKVTWGTGPTPSANVARANLTGLTIGTPYIANALVWIPTGSLDVQPSISGIGYATTVTIRDRWVPVSYIFIATSTGSGGGNAFGFNTIAVATADQHCYIKNVQIESGGVATPFIDPDTDDLASWNGTPRASTSSRVRTPSIPAWEVLEPTTNLSVNPHAEGGGLTGWGASGSDATFARDGSFHPPEAKASVKCSLTATAYSNVGTGGAPASTAGGVRTFSARLKLWSPVARNCWIIVRMYRNGYTTATDTILPVTLPAGGDWTERKDIIVTSPVGTVSIDTISVIVTSGNWTGAAGTAMDIWMAAPQVEELDRSTPFVPQLSPATGSPLTGYYWSGTAHNSASTRAAGRVWIPSPDFDTATGSSIVAFQQPNGFGSGVPRLWEISNYGDSADSITLAMESNANLGIFTTTGGGANTMSSPYYINDLDRPRFRRYYAEWTPTTGALENETGLRVNMTRSVAPVGHPGDGDVNIDIGAQDGTNSFADGLFYNLVIFDRPLTADELDRALDLMSSGEYEWYV